MDDLSQRLAAHLSSTDAAHDVARAFRVLHTAKLIAEGEQHPTTANLIAACLLHDLVTLPKDHPERHKASRMSADAAIKILAAEGFSDDAMLDVRHAIEAHSFSAGIPARTSTARILQDADRLEALGAIGLARVFAVSGALGRPLWHPDDPFAEHRSLDDTRWALDHFEVKLLKLPERMNTETGRRLAKARASVLTRYLDDLKAEIEVGGDV